MFEAAFILIMILALCFGFGSSDSAYKKNKRTMERAPDDVRDKATEAALEAGNGCTWLLLYGALALLLMGLLGALGMGGI